MLIRGWRPRARRLQGWWKGRKGVGGHNHDRRGVSEAVSDGVVVPVAADEDADGVSADVSSQPVIN